MKLIKINDKIAHLKFVNRVEMCKTMLRPSEFVECPNFKGKVFTLKEYKEWYTKRNGKFSYYTDWSGFNTPMKEFLLFKKLFKLSSRERQLSSLLKKLPDDSCLISTYEGSDPSIFEHEMCHAFYNTDLSYRREVDVVMDHCAWDCLPLISFLLSIGYGPGVIKDECHAYLCNDSEYLAKNGVRIPNVVELLQNIKSKYWG